MPAHRPEPRRAAKATLRAAAEIWSASWRADRVATLLVLALSIAQQWMGLGFALSLSVAVNVALAPRPNVAGLVGACAAGGLVVSAGLMAYVWSYRTRIRLRESVDHMVDVGLTERMGEAASVDALERDETANRVELLRRQRVYIGGGLETLTLLVGGVLQLALTVAILTWADAWLCLLPALGVLLALAARWSVGVSGAGRLGAAPHLRAAREIERLATSPHSAAEVFVYGLTGRLIADHARAWRRAGRVVDAANGKAALLLAATWALFVGGYGLAMAMAVSEAAAGQLAVGALVLVLVLSAQVVGNIQGVLASWSQLGVSLQAAAVWNALKASDRTAQPRPAAGAEAPDALVALRDVSFTYPGSDRPALRGVTLSLPRGKFVVLLGENGAGKSTLLKLLGGLIQPGGGQVVFDGGSAAADWRRRVASVFQQPLRLELSVLLAIGVGDAPRRERAEVVSRAAADTEFSDIAARLPHGLDTQIGPAWGGVDFSGGEWQSLGHARAAMRTAPRLLLLDEPTASLDAHAQARAIERYLSLHRSAGGDTTTVLVTHNFAAAHYADLIVVLAEGRVAELGDHAKLIARGGVYSTLLGIQLGALHARPPAERAPAAS